MKSIHCVIWIRTAVLTFTSQLPHTSDCMVTAMARNGPRIAVGHA